MKRSVSGEGGRGNKNERQLFQNVRVVKMKIILNNIKHLKKQKK